MEIAMAYTKQRKGRSPLPRKDMEALAKVTYCLGHCTPNYPVPAIPVCVNWNEPECQMISICQMYLHTDYTQFCWTHFSFVDKDGDFSNDLEDELCVDWLTWADYT